MKRARWASALAFGFVMAAAVPAIAEDGGRVALLQAPFRALDTREAGSRVTSIGLGSGVLNVSVVDMAGSGTATIYRCGDPAPATPTFRFEPSAYVQIARVTSAEDMCLSASVPIHVIVDVGGTVSATPSNDRSQYIALPSPIVLYDGTPITSEVTIRIPRPVSLATDADAVISLEALTGDQPTFIRALGCDHPNPQSADLVYQRNRSANIAIVDLSAGEDICLYVFRPAHVRVKLLGQLATTGPNAANLPPSWRYTASEVPAPSLRAITPVRVLDTRKALGRAGTSPVALNEVVELDFGSLVGPLTTAVVLNVTVTQPDRAGFLTAWPCGGDRPTVSNLNFDPGDSVPNLVVSKLGPGGTVCLSGVANMHLIADLNGTYEADGGLQAVPVEPTRILDTRRALGTPQAARIAAGQTLELQVVGNGLVDVPAAAGAVTMNITATDATGGGFLTVYPCGSDRPDASNVNYQPGQSIPNLVMSKLSPTGTLCIFALTDVHVLADVAAWFGVDQPAGLVELPPQRILDTRNAQGVPTTSPVAGGTFIKVDVAGQAGVADDADAVVVNLTATATQGNGFVTAWPCDRSMPIVSNLNYGPGETNPNLATVKLAADGSMCLYTAATTHLLADVAGYFTAQPVQGQQLTLG